MVFHGWRVARLASRRAVHGSDQFHRALWTSAGRGVSFRTRCRVGRGVVGCVAAPAMVALGDGTHGDVYVRFNSVGSVSLRHGCFRRDGHRDAGVCDRQLDHENARRGCDGSAVNLPAQRECWPNLSDGKPSKQRRILGGTHRARATALNS